VGLRIRLHIAPPELMVLPWELIFEEEYLGLRLRFPVVRYLDLPDRPKPLAVQPPLRMLLAISQPQDLPLFDVDAELANIRAAVDQLPAKIKVDVLDVARRDDLLSRLRQDYHVLHYVGHGTFDGREGHLILEDSEGRSDPVSALLLGQMVSDSNLRLAVLNACETSLIGRGRDFGGVAHRLVGGGVPAVVAMQASIHHPSSVAFSREFYSALASGWSVDAAVQEGRRGIITAFGSDWSDHVDWAIPTLYMRAPDGMILDVQEGLPAV
jgi:CHAT domain-containing protein